MIAICLGAAANERTGVWAACIKLQDRRLFSTCYLRLHALHESLALLLGDPWLTLPCTKSKLVIKTGDSSLPVLLGRKTNILTRQLELQAMLRGIVEWVPETVFCHWLLSSWDTYSFAPVGDIVSRNLQSSTSIMDVTGRSIRLPLVYINTLKSL